MTRAMWSLFFSLGQRFLELSLGFVEPGHLVPLGPGLIDHPPRLAVALPDLTRVGLAQRPLRLAVPGHLDLHARGALVLAVNADHLVVGDLEVVGAFVLLV